METLIAVANSLQPEIRTGITDVLGNNVQGVRNIFAVVTALLPLAANLALKQPVEVASYAKTLSFVLLLVIVACFTFLIPVLVGLAGWVVLVSISLLLVAVPLVFWYVDFHKNSIFQCIYDKTRHLQGWELTSVARDALTNGVGTPPVVPENQWDYFCRFVGKQPYDVWTSASYNMRWWRCLVLSTLIPITILSGLYLGVAAATIPALNVTETSEGQKFTVQGEILFATNEYTLRDTEIIEMEEVMTAIKRKPPSRILIVGHTDTTGSTDYNKTLSEKRAMSVAGWLRESIAATKLKAIHIDTEGQGESNPLVAPEANELDKQKNRRVEITLFSS